MSDADCDQYPETVCAAEPLNSGLDPGTRKLPFESWEDRDTLLKSCFCREGHLRIPISKGCYDPIRQVGFKLDLRFSGNGTACTPLPIRDSTAGS